MDKNNEYDNQQGEFLDHQLSENNSISGEYEVNEVSEDKQNLPPNDISLENQANRGSSSSSKAIIAMTILVMFFVALVVLLFSGVSYLVSRFGPIAEISDKTEVDVSAISPSMDYSSDDRHFSIEDATRLPDQAGKRALSTIEIAALVGPATVSIEADIQYGISSDGPVFSSAGSGFIISEDGYIVTNLHVISGAQMVRVVIPGFDDSFLAQVVGRDDQTDIAVLKIDVETPLPFVLLGDSDKLLPGELAVAIGNPFGELAGTVTVGVISAINREVDFGRDSFVLIQTDASINAGNSGGPLLNSFGEVVGVTNAKISTGEGLGFAIPINNVRDIISEIIEQGYVSGRPIMGVVLVTIDNYSADIYGWPVGAYVRDITADGPAEKAGLVPGDIIISMNGQLIQTTEDVLQIRNSLEVGDEIDLGIFRNGERIVTTMILEEGNVS